MEIDKARMKSEYISGDYDSFFKDAAEVTGYLLNKKYVLISLYVDDKTPLTEPIEVTENGQQRTLRTVGDKWSYLQRTKFGANAQPFYVLLNNEGHPLMGSRSYDEDVAAYVDFLRQGLKKYVER